MGKARVNFKITREELGYYHKIARMNGYPTVDEYFHDSGRQRAIHFVKQVEKLRKEKADADRAQDSSGDVSASGTESVQGNPSSEVEKSSHPGPKSSG